MRQRVGVKTVGWGPRAATQAAPFPREMGNGRLKRPVMDEKVDESLRMYVVSISMFLSKSQALLGKTKC